MMFVTIQIQGPRASGKTWLMSRLRKVLDDTYYEVQPILDIEDDERGMEEISVAVRKPKL